MNYESALDVAARGGGTVGPQRIRRAVWPFGEHVVYQSSSGTVDGSVYRPHFHRGLNPNGPYVDWSPSEEDRAAEDWETIRVQYMRLDGPPDRPRG
jgi:hypothetical protein